MKRINFCLWDTSLTRGVRVILEVANRLAKRDYKVTITLLGGSLPKWFAFDSKARVRARDHNCH